MKTVLINIPWQLRKAPESFPFHRSSPSARPRSRCFPRCRKRACEPRWPHLPVVHSLCPPWDRSCWTNVRLRPRVVASLLPRSLPVDTRAPCHRCPLTAIQQINVLTKKILYFFKGLRFVMDLSRKLPCRSHPRSWSSQCSGTAFRPVARQSQL